jgi:hypothetical protein
MADGMRFGDQTIVKPFTAVGILSARAAEALA